jgi:hypothetical protein
MPSPLVTETTAVRGQGHAMTRAPTGAYLPTWCHVFEDTVELFQVEQSKAMDLFLSKMGNDTAWITEFRLDDRMNGKVVDNVSCWIERLKRMHRKDSAPLSRFVMSIPVKREPHAAATHVSAPAASVSSLLPVSVTSGSAAAKDHRPIVKRRLWNGLRVPRSSKPCFHCDMPGHVQRNCPFLCANVEWIDELRKQRPE